MSEPTPPSARLVTVARPSIDIYGGEGSLWSTLAKAARQGAEGGGTNAGVLSGVRPPLIDKVASRRIKDLNTTHATCLSSKRRSTVGMGHRDQAIHDALDAYCRHSWQDTLNSIFDDHFGEGDGFMEVVWDPGRTEVLGLNHLDGNLVSIVVELENDSERFHYQVTSRSGTKETVAMAKWGDLLGLRARYGGDVVRNDELAREARPQGRALAPLGGRIVDSEVIQFRMANPRDPYQGYPDWVSATPAIELVQAFTQHEFDFHFNRGVPEVIYEVTGGSINQPDWDKIVAIFQGSQGIGNSRKSAAIHLPGSPESMRTVMHRLERGQEEPFGDKAMALAMLIATAHSTPPMLANIALPGKIGAANEGPNALLLFQKMYLGQVQKECSRILANSLGQESGLGVSANQFLGNDYDSGTDENGAPIYHEEGNGFKTVLDGMTLGAQQTLASMREPIAGSGRNPADGLLGGASDRKAGDPRKTRA